MNTSRVWIVSTWNVCWMVDISVQLHRLGKRVNDAECLWITNSKSQKYTSKSATGFWHSQIKSIMWKTWHRMNVLHRNGRTKLRIFSWNQIEHDLAVQSLQSQTTQPVQLCRNIKHCTCSYKSDKESSIGSFC